MKYQVRYREGMRDMPMSPVYDTRAEARTAYDEIRVQILATWKTPDASGLYIDERRPIEKRKR